jgi:hypothetical protein
VSGQETDKWRYHVQPCWLKRKDATFEWAINSKLILKSVFAEIFNMVLTVMLLKNSSINVPKSYKKLG